MKTTLLVAIFLLANVLWTRASKELENEEVLGPLNACFVNYCDCIGSTLNCTITFVEQFEELSTALRKDSNDYYGQVLFYLKAAFDIPADVLGGKKAQELDLYYPDSSTSPGEIHADAFQSTLNYTTMFNFHTANLTSFRFSFLSQFSALKKLRIRDSSMRKINDMPYLPELTTITIVNTPDLESWYSPSTTPNLGYIQISNNPDLDDEKMDKILSSMFQFYTYQKLTDLWLPNNALTRVPPLAFAFPALEYLFMHYNLIQNITTGSLNNTYNNLVYFSLQFNKLTNFESEPFIGNFSSTQFDWQYNLPTMNSFPESTFRNLLESMVGHTGYVDIRLNPIVNDCGLAWLIRDHRHLLPYVLNGAIANGTYFTDLNPDEYSDCE